MTTAEMIVEKVKELVAPLSRTDRLEIIRSIEELALDSTNGKRTDQTAAEAEDPMFVEQEKWFALPVSLRERFRGRYIAVQNQQVIDEDEDRLALTRRVRSQFLNAPIPILNGDWDETPTYSFPSFHLEK